MLNQSEKTFKGWLRRREFFQSAFSNSKWKEIGWVFLGQVASVVGSLVALKVLTTVLSPRVYGEVNLIVISCALPSLVMLAPLIQSCYRFYSEYAERGSLSGLIGTTIIMQTWVVLLVGTSLVVAMQLGFFDCTGISRSTIVCGFVLFTLDSGRNMCLTIASAARKRAIVAVGFAADAWLRPLGAIIFISLLGKESGPAIAGFAVAGLCSLIPLSLWLAQSIDGFRIERKIMSDIIQYGLPYGIWGIFGWAQAGADRYMVDHWLTRSDVGRYVVAVQVSTFPISVAGAFVGQLINPVLFQRAGDGSDLKRRKSARSLLLITLAFFLVFGMGMLSAYYFFGLRLLHALVGQLDYGVSIQVLLLLVIGGIFFQIAQLCSSIFLIQKKTMLLVWPKMLGGVAAVLSGVLAIPRYGLSGAAFSAVFASAVLLAAHWIGPTRKAWQADGEVVSPEKEIPTVGP